MKLHIDSPKDFLFFNRIHSNVNVKMNENMDFGVIVVFTPKRDAEFLSS